MKKIVFAFTIFLFCACSSSKKKTADTGSDNALEQRLAEFMKVNDEMNLDKVMEYIYPKLFTLVARPDLEKAMKLGVDNEKVKIEMDSLKVDTLYPVFQMGKASYAKIKYSMIMLMDFHTPDDSVATQSPPSKNTGINHSIGDDAYPAPQKTLMVSLLAQQYGPLNVSLDNKTGLIKVRTINPIVAVKDEFAKEWCFVNLKEEDPFIKKLFSPEVLDKLATYK
jgi:hypothetical protein